MLVDELYIPHRDGPVRVRLDERVTVFAGLGEVARARLAVLFTQALACEGPACVQVRDEEGQVALLSRRGARDVTGDVVEGPVPRIVADVEALARLMIVRPVDLGLQPGRPDPRLHAEWTAASIEHRRLVHELGAMEAAVTERHRLEAELGEELRGPVIPTAAAAPAADPLDAAALGPRVDELLRRRAAADQLLVETADAVRAATEGADATTPAAASPAGKALVVNLRAAVSALRRVETRRRDLAGLGTQSPEVGGADPDPTVRADAEVVVRRATEDVESARAAARSEIEACDAELASLAEAAGLDVGPEGPGAALTAALAGTGTATPSAGPRPAGAATGDDELTTSAARRLILRRRAMLRSRISELPSDDDVEAARRRMASSVERLRRLEADDPALGLEVATHVRTVLLGRATALRPQGITCAAPLVLDDPLVRLVPDERCDLLDVILRVAERIQVVLLTEDEGVIAWARARAQRGELRLIDMSASSAG